MRVGIASDHGGFDLKHELVGQLRVAGHEIIDFGANSLTQDDDYPDFVIPLGRAVAARPGRTWRGDLRQRRWRIGLCQQDPRCPGCVDPRSFFGAAGGRG